MLSIQALQTLIVIYRKGKLVYNPWVSIYRPLSYSFRSQQNIPNYSMSIVSHDHFIKNDIVENQIKCQHSSTGYALNLI